LANSGTVLSIGAIFNDGSGTSAGHARIYGWSGSAWVQQGSDIDGEAAGDRSGFCVPLSNDGTIVAIGAKFNSGNGTSSGQVRVYQFNPEIKITGNSQEIADGDNTPSTSDNTDFGSTSLPVTKEFNIENTSGFPLNLSGSPKIAVSGTNASDFEIINQPNSSVDAFSTVSFQVKFTPSSIGSKTATITIESNDLDESTYTFDIAAEAVQEDFISDDITENGTATANVTQTTYYPSQAWNNNTGNYWRTPSSSYNRYTTYDLGSGNAAAATRYKIFIENTGVTPKKWKLQGSNSSSSGFVDLHTNELASRPAVSTNSGVYYEYSFTNSTAYRYYRLYIYYNFGGSGYVRVKDCQIFTSEHGIAHGSNTTSTLDELTLTSSQNSGFALKEYGDIIKIGTPTGSFNEVATQLPSNSNLAARIDKTWPFQVQDANANGGKLTISFNIGSSLNPAYTYYLLGRNGSGNFAEIPISGYKFQNQKVVLTADLLDLTDGWEYTLGRSDFGSGHCLNFDGSNDYVDLGDVDESSGKISVEMWVKFNNNNTNQALFSKLNFSNGQNDDPYGAYYNGSADYLYWYANGYYWRKTWVPTVDQWYHLAFTYENGSYNLYIDGVRIYKDQAMNRGSLVNSSNPLLLGAWKTNSTVEYFFNGEMDEVRVWSDIRTFQEIRKNMHRRINGNEQGLNAYFRMDRSLGSELPDVSKKSNDGTLNQFALTGSSSNWVESTAPVGDSSLNSSIIGPGNALHFDGSNDYVDCNDVMDVSTGLTLSAWVRPDAIVSSSTYMVSKFHFSSGSASDDSYALYVWNGNLRLLVSNGSTYETKTAALEGYSANTWHHLAVTYNGSTVNFYQNGILIGTQTTAISSINNSSTDFVIGALTNNSAIAYHFDGQIDELRVWNVARTQTQIQDDMYATLDGDETGLIGYYLFDEQYGTTLYETTSNGHDGTLANFSGTYFVDASSREPYKTIASGSHNTGATWKGGSAPSTSTDRLAVFHDLTIAASGTYNRLQVNSNKSLTINSDLTVNGDVIVNGTCSGTNKIILGGSSKQCLGGSGTINDIQINNSNDISLDGDLTIGGALTLTSGDIEVNDHTLTLSGTTSHGSASSYLKLNGSGRVIKAVNSDPVILPIGRNPYLPIIIDDGGGAEYTVGVSEGIYDNPVTETTLQTGNVVGETWTIQSSAAQSNVLVTLQWDASEEETGFNRSSSFLSHWENGVSSNWDVGTSMSASGSGPYSLTRTVNFSTNLFYFGVGSAGSALPVEFTYFD
ncbi:MAG: LamG-like jellyroll fold domain-containing protein, partial [Bacteroidia bacterium]